MAIDNSTYFIEAFIYLLTFNLGMGDSISEVSDWMTWEAFHDYHYFDDYKDSLEDTWMSDWDIDTKILEKCVEELVKTKSKSISEALLPLFTEEDLIDDIFDHLSDSHADEMADALEAIDSVISDFPGGEEVKEALEENILDKC